MDGGWWLVVYLSLMLYIKFGCHPPPTTTTNTGRLILLNSLLPVSRYIDTALAEKESHKKKLTTKIFRKSKFGLLGKPTKKLESNPLF